MSDNERCFVDTNVLLYLYSGTEKDKQQRAQEYVDNCECVISTQVLNEFSNVCINTEDMHDGQVIEDSVTIKNIFKTASHT